MVKKKETIVTDIDFSNNADVSPIDSPIVLTVEAPEGPPVMYDPEWSDYVMGQFEPNELDEGLPKVNGLLRLTRKLLGPIVKITPDTKQVPTIENEQRATVQITVTILRKYNLEDDEEPYLMEFGDVADAYVHNIKGLEYAIFPTANASTRALVRALRRALNLDTVASEEISDQPIESAGLDGQISESQISKLDLKCHQLDINVMKFINIGKTKYNKIEDVKSSIFIKMFSRINEYQRKVLPIPDSILGYDPNWRGDLQS